MAKEYRRNQDPDTSHAGAEEVEGQYACRVWLRIYVISETNRGPRPNWTAEELGIAAFRAGVCKSDAAGRRNADRLHLPGGTFLSPVLDAQGKQVLRAQRSGSMARVWELRRRRVIPRR